MYIYNKIYFVSCSVGIVLRYVYNILHGMDDKTYFIKIGKVPICDKNVLYKYIRVISLTILVRTFM